MNDTNEKIIKIKKQIKNKHKRKICLGYLLLSFDYYHGDPDLSFVDDNLDIAIDTGLQIIKKQGVAHVEVHKVVLNQQGHIEIQYLWASP